MSVVRIDCIIPDGADADRRIDRLGGPRPDGPERWEDPIDNIINYIRNGTHSFYTMVGNRAVDVVVRVHPTSGRFYLTTEGDGFPPNNLLNLGRCQR
ncbi:DUF3892 domain-containing protein [Sphingobium sp. B8D3A]|uniref:DUF3892 domain-containing protein n=1 Tax=unclassified Sphingobium TaxID=2611147 RepID=UPI0039B605E6